MDHHDRSSMKITMNQSTMNLTMEFPAVQHSYLSCNLRIFWATGRKFRKSIYRETSVTWLGDTRSHSPYGTARYGMIRPIMNFDVVNTAHHQAWGNHMMANRSQWSEGDYDHCYSTSILKNYFNGTQYPTASRALLDFGLLGWPHRLIPSSNFHPMVNGPKHLQILTSTMVSGRC